ncbi:MAG: ISAs1 family transposase [Microbacteriaceae bacterium]|nr:MAG: ISAs1 family transposase [Microbacteriaceae bacterium]
MLSSLICSESVALIGPDVSPLSLAEVLERVPDPRQARGMRYPLGEILAVVVCAVVAGSRSFTMIAEWAAHAATYRPMTQSGRVPSLATIHRLCTLVDAEALDAALTGWTREKCRPKAIAIDGKEVRGAKHADGERVFLMGALDHDTGCVLGQELVGAKTNEIPHLPTLLDQLGDISGVVVTADALHTLARQAEPLHDRGAHYVFTVKGNQPGLRDRIASQTWASLAPQHTLTEKGHGRTSTWQITVQHAQDWIGFPHAKQTIRLMRDRIDHRSGDASREPVYAITSLSPEQASPAELAALIRGHWGIENRLHWVRDVTFDEDRSQIRTGHGPRLMAAVRNLAISIHRLAGATSIAHATRATMREPEIARHLTEL